MKAALALLLLAACTEAAADQKVARDWKAHPAIVEIDDADELYALSDPHGGTKELVKLLKANKLTDGKAWTGGSATLVVAGDLIDKGPDSLGVIDFLRALQASAAKGGGRVVVTMGNHEAEFLVDPHNKKASSTGDDKAGIDSQVKDPDALAAGKDAEGRGAWLAELPLGVRVKKWFFAHGGNTAGRSVAQLEQALESAVSTSGWKGVTGEDSILEAQAWYGKGKKSDVGQQYADALGVKHIVFGHDPGAFKEHGRIVASPDGVLVKLDVEMGLHGADAVQGGLLLHVKTKGKDAAEVLDSDGKASPLPSL